MYTKKIWTKFFRQKNKLLLFLLLTVIQCKQRCTRIVAAGENGNDLNYFGLYLNKSVMVIITKIYDRDRFL
jgi:hypothetical protein